MRQEQIKKLEFHRMIDKNSVDIFCRAYLLDAIDQGEYKDYGGLTSYIVHEMSYNEVVLSVGRNFDMLEEANLGEVEADAQRNLRLKNTEGIISGIMTLSLALFAGGIKKKLLHSFKTGKNKGYYTAVAKKIGNTAKTLGLTPKPGGRHTGLSKIAGKLGKGGKAAAAVFMIMVGYEIMSKLLTKILFISIEKRKSLCKDKCRKENHQGLDLKICISRCKIGGLADVIAKLRRDVSDCKVTDNPESCQRKLIEHVAKYNDILKTEEERLKKFKVAARKADQSQSTERKTGSIEPPETQ
jgi:hypothetical protein